MTPKKLEAGGKPSTKLPPGGLVEHIFQLEAGGKPSTWLPPGGLVEHIFQIGKLKRSHNNEQHDKKYNKQHKHHKTKHKITHIGNS